MEYFNDVILKSEKGFAHLAGSQDVGRCGTQKRSKQYIAGKQRDPTWSWNPAETSEELRNEVQVAHKKD